MVWSVNVGKVVKKGRPFLTTLPTLTDQTTTLCVQEVEIYLERWEVLGALVDVCVWKGEKVVKKEDAYAIFLN